MLNAVGRACGRLAGAAARSLVTGSPRAKLWVVLGLVAIVAVLGPVLPSVADVGGAVILLAALVAILSYMVRAA